MVSLTRLDVCYYYAFSPILLSSTQLKDHPVVHTVFFNQTELLQTSLERGAIMQEVPYRNRPPSEYHRYLCQFSEMKLKAMQDAFLAGHDLLPFLEGKSFSYTHPTPANYEEFYNSTVPLTTAVSWSLAAPEALHFGKVKNTIRTSTENSTVSESWESARRPPPGPLDSVIQGEFCSLSGWMKDWKGSSQHLRAIKMAISGSQEELGRDKFGVRIIGHADFGLKRVGESFFLMLRESRFSYKMNSVKFTSGSVILGDVSRFGLFWATREPRALYSHDTVQISWNPAHDCALEILTSRKWEGLCQFFFPLSCWSLLEIRSATFIYYRLDIFHLIFGKFGRRQILLRTVFRNIAARATKRCYNLRDMKGILVPTYTLYALDVIVVTRSK